MWKPGNEAPNDDDGDDMMMNEEAKKRSSGKINLEESSRNKKKSKNDKNAKMGGRSSRASKSKLSSKTLTMKFMQRSSREKHNADNTKDSMECVSDQDDDIESESPATVLQCIRDDVDPCLIGTGIGRRSFGGFNPAIETAWATVDRQNKYTAAEERELREEVSAEEMTRRMQKYVGLRNKTGGGNRRPKKNSKK